MCSSYGLGKVPTRYQKPFLHNLFIFATIQEPMLYCPIPHTHFTILITQQRAHIAGLLEPFRWLLPKDLLHIKWIMRTCLAGPDKGGCLTNSNCYTCLPIIANLNPPLKLLKKLTSFSMSSNIWVATWFVWAYCRPKLIRHKLDMPTESWYG